MSQGNEEYLIEGAIVQEWEPKDDLRQEQNLYKLLESAKKILADKPENEQQKLLNDYKQKWLSNSDKGIDTYTEIWRQLSEIKQFVNLFKAEEQKSWDIFNTQIQTELFRIEKYLYFDLASENLPYEDIKYLVTCLSSTLPRLSKFLHFLCNFYQDLQQSQSFSDQFNWLMNLEFKLQTVEPKIQATSDVIKNLDVEIKFIKESAECLRKKSQKTFFKSQEWQNSDKIVDKIEILKNNVVEKKNIIAKMKKSMFGKSLMDFCGDNKLSTLSGEKCEDIISQWQQLPNCIHIQLLQHSEQIKSVKNDIQILYNLWDQLRLKDIERKNRPNFLQKLFGIKKEIQNE